jgi:protein-tyrosine phosphatase
MNEKDNEPSTILTVVNDISNLYLGSIIAAQDGHKLQSLNVGLIVNCAEEISNFFEESSEVFNFNCDYINCSIKDEPDVDLAVHFSTLLPQIHECLYEKKKSVLVHCSQGISRSVTVVLSYLMKYHNMNLKDAFLYTRARRFV